MGTRYKVICSDKFNKDLYLIRKRVNLEYYKRIKEKVNKAIGNLVIMPRIHKTLFYKKDPLGEYRRIIIEKYIIIYKIIDNKIIILRIFNQKEDYLKPNNFILKEDSQKYIIKNGRRKIKMIKFRTLKNSYLKQKENYSRIITGEEVWSRSMDRIIEEAEESLITEGYITLEELREELIGKYNVSI